MSQNSEGRTLQSHPLGTRAGARLQASTIVARAWAVASPFVDIIKTMKGQPSPVYMGHLYVHFSKRSKENAFISLSKMDYGYFKLLAACNANTFAPRS